MATVLTLVNNALQELGVYGAGETVSADDAALCLEALNDILEAWRLENLYIYDTQEVTAALPAATTSRTIGTGGQFNVERPVRLEDGCFVRVGTLDYPLDVVSKADYNDLTLKTLDGPWPRVCVYDAAYPTGTVSFYPRGACTVHLLVQVILSAFTATTNTFAMPPGYKRALELTLAEEVAAKFQKQASPATARRAMNARRVLKRSNLTVPQLQVGAEPQLPGRYAILGG
jgi:hypothetical protein